MYYGHFELEVAEKGVTRKYAGRTEPQRCPLTAIGKAALAAKQILKEMVGRNGRRVKRVRLWLSLLPQGTPLGKIDAYVLNLKGSNPRGTIWTWLARRRKEWERKMEERTRRKRLPAPWKPMPRAPVIYPWTPPEEAERMRAAREAAEREWRERLEKMPPVRRPPVIAPPREKIEEEIPGEWGESEDTMKIKDVYTERPVTMQKRHVMEALKQKGVFPWDVTLEDIGFNIEDPYEFYVNDFSGTPIVSIKVREGKAVITSVETGEVI